jgi:hypothetical protein
MQPYVQTPKTPRCRNNLQIAYDHPNVVLVVEVPSSDSEILHFPELGFIN